MQTLEKLTENIELVSVHQPTAQAQHFSEELEVCDLPRNNKVIVDSSQKVHREFNMTGKFGTNHTEG